MLTLINTGEEMNTFKFVIYLGAMAFAISTGNVDLAFAIGITGLIINGLLRK